jgi:putative ATP-binding cassette transporter
MDYLNFLKNESEILSARFMLFVLVASIANGVLIGTIITAAGNTGEQNQYQLCFLFLLSLGVYLFTRKRILDRTSAMVEGVIRSVRVRICDQVRHAELTSFESIGKSLIQQVLAQDCQTMYEAARDVMLAIAAVGVVFSSLFYIALISLNTLIGIVIVIALAVTVYARNQRAVRRQYEDAAGEDQRFFKILSDQLQGFKELRINASKAQDFFEHDVTVSAKRAEQIRLAITRKLNVNTVFGQAFLFVLLGCVVFILPNFAEQGDIPIPKIASIILFLTGPLTDLATATPVFMRANVAVRRLQSLRQRLALMTEDAAAVADPATLANEPSPPFETLRCDQLVFRYPPQPGRKDDTFQVGPIDLELRRGEMIFLVGGNGSGKSTLIHLLCGLYSNSDGHLFINDTSISNDRRTLQRSYFTIILQDFHLFHRMLGQTQINRQRIDHLLDMLRLRGLTDIDSQGLITNTNLSTGQKKRLALLIAECDDRDIFIFDEWAADQDPDYRRYFYTEYLPELRRRGKTVIAATHDDHYFYIADRILRLDRGQLSTLDHPPHPTTPTIE